MRQTDKQSGGQPRIEALENRRLLSVDLTTAFAGRVPAELPFGRTSVIEVRLTNTSNARVVEPMNVQLFASTIPTAGTDDLLLASRQEDVRLNPRQAVNIKLDVPSPTTLPTGEYYLLADANGSVVTSAPVQIQAPFSDLAVSFAGLPAKPVEIDGYSSGKRVATVDIANIGNLRVNGTADVSLYLSADGALDSTTSLLAKVSNATIALKPGARKALNFRIAVPPGTTVGGYFLIAQLTPGVAVNDTSAVNNVAVSSRRIAVVTQLPHPTTVNNTVNVYVSSDGGGVDGGDTVASSGDECDCSGDSTDDSDDGSAQDNSSGGSDNGSAQDNSGGGSNDDSSDDEDIISNDDC